MSLDISLSIDGEEIRSMNWLRNPFGLCKWAEDNCHRVWKQAPEPLTLWDVCNKWSYNESAKVDRKEFKRVVDLYWQTIDGLEQSYYFFDLPAYRQFIQPNERCLPGHMLFTGGLYAIDGSSYDDRQRLMIPVQHFNHPAFHLADTSTERMKTWFKELVEFADTLQDETYEFYCSN